MEATSFTLLMTVTMLSRRSVPLPVVAMKAVMQMMTRCSLGIGLSVTVRLRRASHVDVFIVSCDDHMNYFLGRVMLGMDSLGGGMNTRACACDLECLRLSGGFVVRVVTNVQVTDLEERIQRVPTL